MQPKYGLVFAGGGGKGAFQIGVWKALAELGLAQQIQVVSGTSVGALNATLFAQGDLIRAEQAWLSMTPSDILKVSSEKVWDDLCTYATNTFAHNHSESITHFLKSGVFAREGLARLIDNAIDRHALLDTQLRCFANCTKLSLSLKPFQAEYFPLHGKELPAIRQILLASSAIPGVFGQEKIDGATYWDGFVTDNLPIKPVYNTGCDHIFVVMLERDTRINPKLFPEATLIPIAPSDDPGHPLNFNSVSEKITKGYYTALDALGSAVETDTMQQRAKELMIDFLEQQKRYMALQKDYEEKTTELATLQQEGEDLSAQLQQLLNVKH